MFFPLIFIVGGLFLISNDMGAVQLYQLRKERNQIRAKIDLYIQNEVELAQELDKLTNDAEYIKKIAQENASPCVIGHVRYSTMGTSTLENAQPLKVKDLCIAVSYTHLTLPTTPYV